MNDSANLSYDAIWSDDLLARQEEANLLCAYIESVWQRPISREDKRSYTIAIDTKYGEGKSFFLRRLAEQLAFNHPVAFIDAWADDITDEPLVALAATLKKALEPLINEDRALRAKWLAVAEKIGKISLIASKGVARRLLSLAITAGSLEAAEAVLSDMPDTTAGSMRDAIKDLSTDTSGERNAVASIISPSSTMNIRIAEFNAARQAVDELTSSLESLVKQLESSGRYPPIVIIIDELDRCRPNYAVKVLEEVKHIFDVPGLVFVLGINGHQLANSISHAYGPQFDGTSYLQRFIDRRYRLREPSLKPLIDLLIKKAGLSDQHFSRVSFRQGNASRGQVELSQSIDIYMRLFGLTARDAFSVIDTLQTCSALANGNQLFSPLIIPLSISIVFKLEMKKHYSYPSTQWNIVLPKVDRSGPEFFHPIHAAEAFLELSSMGDNDLMKKSETDVLASKMFEFIAELTPGRSSYSHPSRYIDLIGTVGRFASNPASDA